ncbi:MAG: tetratricopeptide repeat protein [Bacteroidota bacterium]
MEEAQIESINLITVSEYIPSGGGGPKRHCLTEEFAFSSLFASFFGNEKMKSPAGLRRKPSLIQSFSAVMTNLIKGRTLLGTLDVKKLITFFSFLLLLSTTCFAQTEAQQLLESANTKYKAKDYTGAIKAYEAVLATGLQSEALYYNLGNAYYRNNQYGKAILYYERALLLDPTDADIRHNLQLAEAQKTDEIAVIPTFFLSRWWYNGSLSLGPNGWSVVGMLCLWLGVGGLILWLMGPNRTRKKQGFLAGIGLLVLSLLPLSLAFSAKQYLQNSQEAVVTKPEVSLYSAPDTLSQSLRLLHEGTKVQMIDSLSNWHKVQLSNGDEGWMAMEDVEEI